MSDDLPAIEPRENGPLVAKNVDVLVLSNGTEAEASAIRALCRCGHSQNKPFCDGSHTKVGFKGGAQDVTSLDKTYAYENDGITVQFNKLLCSHAAECAKNAPKVFNTTKRPWVQFNKSDLEAIQQAVTNCPSGALSLTTPTADRDWLRDDVVEIRVEKNGPLRVKNVPIANDHWADGQSPQQYVLCRCGLSGNKPFCDGSHKDKGWSED